MENPGPGYKAVNNETEAFGSRISRNGKKLTYHLKVIQQPLRARACGAGAKSSADRRPVDPPPIVELKIFEGEGPSQQDITFSINANYFLFATLEQARNHAQPRGSAPEQRLTVLTGTPVAGMVCLERPTRAGYFIFPDLSVRHEGRYRLSFTLFEDLRETEDEDRPEDIPQMPGESNGHVSYRLEVRSVPFTVYSAKKFPGLTESTALSRVVAEQGCRVRIRRDVRMRKRDSKGGKEWEGYEDATADVRARMSATPDNASYMAQPPLGYDPVPRPRSGSNASYHSIAPSAHSSRRPSMQEMNQAYHSAGYATSPHTPHSGYQQSSPYGQHQPQPFQQAPFMQQPSAMQPPQPQYGQASGYAPRPAPAAQPSPSQQSYYGYAAAPAPQQNQWSQPLQTQHSYETQEHPHRSSMDYSMQYSHDHHRSSSQYSAPPSAISAEYNTPRHAQEPFHSHSSSQSYQQPPHSYPAHHSSTGSVDSYSQGPRPTPLEPVQPPVRTTGATTPIPLSGRPLFGASNNQLPPLNTVSSIPAAKYVEPVSPAPLTPQHQNGYNSNYSNGTSQPDMHKRSYGQVFNDRHLSQPLRHGARPSEPMNLYGMSPNEVDDAASDSGSVGRPLVYRRATGKQVCRNMEQQQGDFMAGEEQAMCEG